ncbi:MAG: hypothetical protein ABIK44_00035 [candidate division WOR-3 bacterium]
MTLSPKSRSGRGFLLPLFVLLVTLFACCLSQIAWERKLHQLHQIENSHKTIARFFKGLNIRYKSDTIYVFIVPPMVAARIEGTINPFIHYLRKQGVKEDVILLAVSNKKRAAERYLKRRNFESDYSIVTNEKFLNSFELSAGILEVPFVTKFSVRSGELLASYSTDGVIDSSTVAAFISDLSKPKSRRRPQAPASKARIKGARYKPVCQKMLKLYDTEEYPLSTTYYINVSPSGTYLSLMDHMTYYIYIFDLATGRLVNVLFPDSSEEMMFVKVPVMVYQILRQNNVLNSMYFSHDFCNDTTLIITASLPKVVTEVTGEDTNFGYHNVPVLIRKHILDNKPMSCARFQSFPDSVFGGFSHIGASFDSRNQKVFLPFHKGWPAGSQLLDDNAAKEGNPFTDEFYQQNVHQFAVFNFDGEFVQFLGRLEKRFEELKLGYLVSEGFVRISGGVYYSSDRYSGKIHIYNQDLVLTDSITVFENPPPIIPAIDRSKEPLRYLLETFRANFRQRIVDFLITRDLCYVLLLEEGWPVVCRLNLEDKRIRRFVLPRHFLGKEAKYHILRKNESGVVAVTLLESPDETFYCEFIIP